MKEGQLPPRRPAVGDIYGIPMPFGTLILPIAHRVERVDQNGKPHFRMLTGKNGSFIPTYGNFGRIEDPGEILKKTGQPPRVGQSRPGEPARTEAAPNVTPPLTQSMQPAPFPYVPTPPNVEDRPDVKQHLAEYKAAHQPEMPKTEARTDDNHTDVTLAPLKPLDSEELPGVSRRLGIWQSEQKKNKKTKEEE